MSEHFKLFLQETSTLLATVVLYVIYLKLAGRPK